MKTHQDVREALATLKRLLANAETIPDEDILIRRDAIAVTRAHIAAIEWVLESDSILSQVFETMLSSFDECLCAEDVDKAEEAMGRYTARMDRLNRLDDMRN